jgi:hypothetical protein
MYPQQCYRPGHKELFHVKPSDLFLAKNRQMATQFSANGTFCRKFLVFEKTIRQKATKNWFSGMASPQLCLLATDFRVC